MKKMSMNSKHYALLGGGLAVGWLIGWYGGKSYQKTHPAGAVGIDPKTGLPFMGQAVDNIALNFQYANDPNAYSVGLALELLASDAGIAQFLGRAGYTCATWTAMSRDQQRSEVYYLAATGKTNREYSAAGPYTALILNLNSPWTPYDTAITAINAYCLKMAIQATNAPRAARPYLMPIRR